MDKKELLQCVEFFKELAVFETDVTTDEERANHRKVVVVKYSYKGQDFSTKKLYYKHILHQTNVRNPKKIIKYFDGEVYWLDKDENNWARGANQAELEKIVIDDMVPEGNNEFKALLKKIANNDKTGYIQRITAEGKPGQYHHNFENNNHWHDIISLIQEIISKKGEIVDKKFFSRLVFKWDGDKNSERIRSSLAKEVEGKKRTFIDHLYQKIKSIQNIIAVMELQNVLKSKKQIILQGPPGTGKTREAKILAESICSSFKLDSSHKMAIKDVLKTKQQLQTKEGSKFSIERIINDTCHLKINTGKVYSVTFDQLIKVDNDENTSIIGKSYAAAMVNFVKAELVKSQIKLIQFHPAFTYEDFVRGIVVKTDISTTPEYKVVNKVLGEFAKKANESNYEGGTDDFDRAWYALVEDINTGNVSKIGSSNVDVDINSQGNIRFKTPVATYEKTYELYKFGKTDLKYETYNRIVINYLKDENGKYKMKDYVSPTSINSNKPYVLIIDEINRANLPAVLGELIYALEYRGEKVESMYATFEDGNTLILPPNLYIIGTMNTSDRSVGHIDYAIRRRFAFINMLPKVLNDENFEIELFKQVSALFIKNLDEYVKDNTVQLIKSDHLSNEFEPEDVWLGHSYFIKGEGDFSLRKKCEIIPILEEYVKDGILKESAKSIINAL